MNDEPRQRHGLLDVETADKSLPPIGGWVVGERYFANTAAKFWPRLIEEVVRAYPRFTVVALNALATGELDSDQLYPDRALERDLRRLVKTSLTASMEKVIAELDLFGPPAAVAIRIFQEDEEAYADVLPLDSVDADTWPNLLVWLLAWAEVPASQWNPEFVQGEFEAEDPDRGTRYAVTFDLDNRLIDRGFYQRTLLLGASISGHRSMDTTKNL
jgi:hypothetical protein